MREAERRIFAGSVACPNFQRRSMRDAAPSNRAPASVLSVRRDAMERPEPIRLLSLLFQ
jgi:hypothetical protein